MGTITSDFQELLNANNKIKDIIKSLSTLNDHYTSISAGVSDCYIKGNVKDFAAIYDITGETQSTAAQTGCISSQTNLLLGLYNLMEQFLVASLNEMSKKDEEVRKLFILDQFSITPEQYDMYGSSTLEEAYANPEDAQTIINERQAELQEQVNKTNNSNFISSSGGNTSSINHVSEGVKTKKSSKNTHTNNENYSKPVNKPNSSEKYFKHESISNATKNSDITENKSNVNKNSLHFESSSNINENHSAFEENFNSFQNIDEKTDRDSNLNFFSQTSDLNGSKGIENYNGDHNNVKTQNLNDNKNSNNIDSEQQNLKNTNYEQIKYYTFKAEQNFQNEILGSLNGQNTL